MIDPFFFVIEGPEASGKSTFILYLSRFLNKRMDHEILHTKEPGSPHSRACIQCRNIMLDPNSALCKESEIFLFGLDRTNHFKDVIVPNKKTHNIISDRCYDSTVAYQGYGRGLDLDLVKEILVMKPFYQQKKNHNSHLE